MGINNIALRVATVAIVGGVGSTIQGGDFLSGFLSAGVSAGFGAKIGGGAFSVGKLVATSVVGGVASVLGGGKFKNGAITGAMAYAIGHGVNKLVSNSNQANRTTDGSRKTAYVGGAMDSSTGHVLGIFERYRQPGDAYFEWTQGGELADWIDANQSSELTVIGHSYGGDTAAGVVADGHYVDNLRTVDPVGWIKPDFSSVSANSGNWINYDSVGTGITVNNAIATIGGAWNSAPSGFANQHIPVKLEHVDICLVHCRP